jgi:hypothetical protein
LIENDRETIPKGEALMNRRQALSWLAGGLMVLAGCGGKKAAQESNPTEVKEFFDAVNDGDANIVARLLKAKPYLANAKNESGQTPLAVAKTKGDEELISAIQKAGGKE